MQYKTCVSLIFYLNVKGLNYLVGGIIIKQVKLGQLYERFFVLIASKLEKRTTIKMPQPF